MLASFRRIPSKHPLTTTAFVAFGALWTSYQLYKLSLFTHVHFLRSSSIGRYKSQTDGASAWALVTGSSDGVGRSFAEELCSRGFNVVLHGRNEKKLEVVRAELIKQWPQRAIRIFVHDAASSPGGPSLNAAVEQLKDLNLKVLINNIGGDGGSARERGLWIPLHEYEETRIRRFLDLTSRFPTELTRLLLPQLIEDSPALIINVGSFVSELAAPYISVYGAAKAYNKMWSRSLTSEMQVDERDVEVLFVPLGMVSTPNEPRPENFFIPSSRKIAKGALDKVGCGRDVVFGYWPHELQYHLMVDWLPNWIQRNVLLGMVKKMKEEEQRNLKAK